MCDCQHHICCIPSSLLSEGLGLSTSFNPNLPFGVMRYSLYDINLINIHEHNLHMISLFVFFFIQNKAKTVLFAMIYNLPWFKIILTFLDLIASRYSPPPAENPQNGVVKVGLRKLMVKRFNVTANLNSFRQYRQHLFGTDSFQVKLNFLSICCHPTIFQGKPLFGIIF